MAKYTIYKITNDNDQCVIDATNEDSSLNDELNKHNIGGSIVSVYEMDTHCYMEVAMALCFYKHKTCDGSIHIVNVIPCSGDLNSFVGLASIEYDEPSEQCLNYIYTKWGHKRTPPPSTTQVKCDICGIQTMRKNLNRHKHSNRCIAPNQSVIKSKPTDKIECDICGFVTMRKNLNRHKHSNKCIAPNQSITKSKPTDKIECELCGFVTMCKNLKQHQSNSRCKRRQQGIKAQDPKQKVSCIYCGFKTHPCNMKRHQQSTNCICLSLIHTHTHTHWFKFKFKRWSRYLDRWYVAIAVAHWRVLYEGMNKVVWLWSGDNSSAFTIAHRRVLCIVGSDG